MSTSLQRSTDTYKQCISGFAYLLHDSWFVYDPSEKLRKAHDLCVKAAISLEECNVDCEKLSSWEDKRECWKTCMSIRKDV